MSNPNNNTQCVICTSILTKPERIRAYFDNLKTVAATERENTKLMMVLWQVLKERGGTIMVGEIPKPEELNGRTISFQPSEDGKSLTISLPRDVIVHADHSILSP